VKTVREVMTENPACCTPETTLEEVGQMMIDNDCGEIPVVDSAASRTPIGVITDRDIVCRAVAQGRDTRSMRVGDCMTTPCVTISPDQSIEDCVKVLEESGIRRVPVVDEAGVCCGIVAQADIARAAKNQAAQLLNTVST
jgi:CBS domain-containing protein